MTRTQDTPYGLRMPKGMRAQVKALAAENGRSMNAEIVFHLRKALGEAAGGSFGDQAPAAGSNNAALPGGASINTGIGGAHDECPNG